MFNQKRRYLIAEEKDVTTVLTAIDNHLGFLSNNSKVVGNCGWAEEPTKWYIHFYASEREWGKIARNLSETGKINVHVAPSGTTDLYFKRN